MSLIALLMLIALVLLVGVLIGSIGIGGVILVPVLHYIGGIDIRIAIAACMLSYALSGLVGSWIYARRGSIRWREGTCLCLGAIPGAYCGALTLSVLPATISKLIIAAFIILAGFNALLQTKEVKYAAPSQDWVLLLIGAGAGFGSALTGTGGPLLLIPLLMCLNYPVLTSVGLGQIIQVPIAISATLGNWRHGQVDVVLALLIAIGLMVGVSLGAGLAHQIPVFILKRTVAIVLIALGIIMVWQIAV